MPAPRRLILPGQPTLAFALLLFLLTVLWIAGGASRADVLGQPIVRGAAALALIIGILGGLRPDLRSARMPVILLAASVGLVLLQLVPLPPAIWQALPGRSILAEAAAVIGEPQPWRPWTMTPSATANAAGSLLVPAAVLLLVLCLTEAERRRVPGILLAWIAASMVVGLLQLSGGGFDNALVNDKPGDVGGMFANRNHFALLLAAGCVIAPVWAFLGGRGAVWRGLLALACVLLFLLTIVASGSRTGLALAAVGIAAGIVLIRRDLRRALRFAPRWTLPAVMAGSVALLALLVLISFQADRAASITRLLEIDAAGDTRVRALPTVLAMIGTYFPAGAGFGGFDPLFRIHEPLHLLKPTYFNHAHNDLLEIVLEGGLPAAILAGAAFGWFLAASIRAWRRGGVLQRAGSAVLLLVLIASVFDYPARTPMIMALVIVALVWFASDPRAGEGDALRQTGQEL